MRLLAALGAMLALAATAPAQLMVGDTFVASNFGLTHIRANVATSVVPVATDGLTIAFVGFGNGSIETVTGTDYLLYAEGAGSFGLYLIDFSASISAPTSTRLGVATAGMPNLSFERASGDAFALTTTGNVLRVAGPIGPGATLSTVPWLSGQTGAAALAARANGSFLLGDQSHAWSAAAGATAPGPTVVTFLSSGLGDLALDGANDRLFVAGFGNQRVDAYELSSGTFLGTIVNGPQVSTPESVDYDARTDTLYSLSRLAPTLGGMLWGNQISFDNVVVCTPVDQGSAASFGCSPMSGHGNTGINAFLALVRAEDMRLDLDPASVTTTFDAMSGTFAASGTIAAITAGNLVTSAAVDPLVGATLQVSGSYSGTDLVGFGDVAFGALAVEIFQTATPPGTADLAIAAAAAANAGPVVDFTGATGAAVSRQRRFTLTGAMPTVNGGSSALLARFAAAAVAGALTLDLDLESALLSGVGVNLGPTDRDLELRLGTLGGGDLVLGTIGAPPFATLFHLATPLVTTPTGTGPFLGLAADVTLFDQLFSPQGAEPFHVLAGPAGTYAFTLPPGSIPAGLSLDYLAIAWDVPNALVTMTRPGTITF
ncbi:MAG: hypothetical protein R3F20_06090 [Planctomycetota bacterium]